MASEPLPVSAPVQPEAKISAVGRIVGVFFSPKATLEDIARKPNWILPVIITTVLAIVALTTLNQRMNWRDYIRDKIDKDPRAAQMSAEQKDKQVEISAKVTTYILYGAGVFGTIIFVTVVSGILMGAYNLLSGAGAKYPQAMAVVAHAGLVAIVSTPIFLLILFLKPPGTIDPDNPMATNVAAFLPEDAAKWLVTFCKSLDVFTIWSLILMAIGFAAINPRKLKGAKSFAIVFSIWGAYVLVRTLWAFVFS
ncbi:MAG TPA: YIP1 family protein [Candidatus Eremiobacteraceae bacterium]|nr:YIP1 family protein [Candidatus Eremiobacteraceae bacterium]